MRNVRQNQVAENDQGRDPGADFEALIATIERSPIVAAGVAASALSHVLDGVITGEGPTTRGRVHFSRALDDADAALCARILIASGGDTGAPVSRAEAEVLVDIDAAAAERTDNGAFDDLLAKAITHCVQAAVGQPVPPRHIALAPETPLSSWAMPQANSADHEVLQWLVSEAKNGKRGTLMAIAAFLLGVSTLTHSFVSVFDLSA